MARTDKNISPSSFIKIPDLERTYTSALPAFNALRREAEFTIAEALGKLDVKIHQIEGRVKALNSIVQKANNKQVDRPLEDIVDLVGIRVICLFRNDMERVGAAIRSVFNVLSVDDKVNADTETFGYVSNHYVCSMRTDYSGPRYDQIKDIKFEIQVRTLGMHAWAAVSHYLSYKGDWDIPDEMKKSLNALSGLFYIADNEFQNAYRARDVSLSSAVERIKKSYDEPVNLDSVMAYLLEKYPSRVHSPSETVSELVKELHDAGYESVESVDKDLNRAADAFVAYEEDRPPNNSPRTKYADVGAVRGALRISSTKFRELSPTDPDKYSDYEHLLLG